MTTNIEDNSKKTTYYSNCVKRRFKNKRVSLFKIDESYQFDLYNYDKENANTPSVNHSVEKGVIRVSSLAVSKETLLAILLNIMDILEIEKLTYEMDRNNKRQQTTRRNVKSKR